MSKPPLNPQHLPASARAATLAVHGGVERSQFGELAEAMFLTSSFTYADMETAAARFAGDDPGFMYSRTGNPTVAMFEARIAALEGAPAALATATGMAAVSGALLSILKTGDRIVSSRQLFGSCRWIVRELLPKFGVEVAFVDVWDTDAWRAAATPGTRLLFLETPANPTLELADLPAIAAIARAAGALTVVDNALSSPVVQRPWQLGADVVIYSATKHIDGHGRCLGGVVLAGEATMDDMVAPFLRHTGGALSPFNAWVLLKSLESLELRVTRQAATAAALADALAELPGVARVIYPGRTDNPQHALARAQMANGGTVVSAEFADRDSAFRFANALRVVRISNNFGDAKSIVTHPATSTHQNVPAAEREAAGITEGLLRFSAGLEHPDDLVEDLRQAAAQR